MTAQKRLYPLDRVWILALHSAVSLTLREILVSCTLRLQDNRSLKALCQVRQATGPITGMQTLHGDSEAAHLSALSTGCLLSEWQTRQMKQVSCNQKLGGGTASSNLLLPLHVVEMRTIAALEVQLPPSKWAEE